MPRNNSLFSPSELDISLQDVSNSSLFPLADWEAPTFTRAAQFRVGATLLLFLFAAVSNLALLISVCHGRGRRLASHLRPLITSLAAADLMMTFIMMPLDMVWNVTVQWHGGNGLCKLLSFLKLFAMQASAFILVVISLDRQHAILNPLDTINAHRRNKRMLVFAWSLSLLLASPQVGYSTSHIKKKKVKLCSAIFLIDAQACTVHYVNSVIFLGSLTQSHCSNGPLIPL